MSLEGDLTLREDFVSIQAARLWLWHSSSMSMQEHSVEHIESQMARCSRWLVRYKGLYTTNYTLQPLT